MWLHTKVIKNVLDFCAEIYPTVDYGFTTIPTYPSGQIGFILCSLNKVFRSTIDLYLFIWVNYSSVIYIKSTFI